MSKTLDLNKWSHGLDYELIPVNTSANDQAWEVRVQRDYPETVLRFGNIKYDGNRDCLAFDYMVTYSPIEDLTSEDPELQKVAGSILSDIIERATNEGWLHYEEIKHEAGDILWEDVGEDFGDQIRTDDIEESTNQ